MEIPGLDHATLEVADLDRSIVFYRDLLGMVLRARWAEGAYLETGRAFGPACRSGRSPRGTTTPTSLSTCSRRRSWS